MSLTLGRRILGAGDLNNVEVLSAHGIGLFEQKFTRAAAFFDEIRPYEASVERFILRGDQPVDQNDGNPGGLGLGEHGIPSVLHDGRKGNHVHAIRNEGTDGVNLLFLLLIGVEHHQAHTMTLGSFLNAARTPHAPGAFRAKLREAQQHGRGGGGSSLLNVFVRRAGGKQRRAKA